MTATLFLSFVISVFILAVMDRHGDFPHHVDRVVWFSFVLFINDSSNEFFKVIALSCLHVVTTTLQVTNYFRQEGPLLHFRYWKISFTSFFNHNTI